LLGEVHLSEPHVDLCSEILKAPNDQVQSAFDVFQKHVHSVFVAKYRRNVFDKVALSKLVNSREDASSRVLRRERPDRAQRTYHKGVLWSPSYFAASCGGAPIGIIRQYIEQQQTPDQPSGTPCGVRATCAARSISPINREACRAPWA
jgi:REP element-mobilizing transposase RayT